MPAWIASPSSPGRGKRAIEDQFDITYELEDEQISGPPKEERLSGIPRLIEHCALSTTRQIQMKELGHPILTSEILIGNEPFGLVLAADPCVNEGDGVMAQMQEVYREHQCSVVAIEEAPPQTVDQYGVTSGEPVGDGVYGVTDMV